MKKEKLSLKSIKNVLNRDEMKKIMAGSGPQCGSYGAVCGGIGGYPVNALPCCPGLNCVGQPNEGAAYCG